MRPADEAEQAPLIKVQHTLIDLIEFLDPQQWRLPARGGYPRGSGTRLVLSDLPAKPLATD